MMSSMTEDQIIRHLRNYVAVQFFGSINTQREYAETAFLIAQSALSMEKNLEIAPTIEATTQTQG